MAKIITETLELKQRMNSLSRESNNERCWSFHVGLREYNLDFTLDFTTEEDTEDGQRLTDEQVVSISNIARQNINSIFSQNTLMLWHQVFQMMVKLKIHNLSNEFTRRRIWK